MCSIRYIFELEASYRLNHQTHHPSEFTRLEAAQANIP